MTGQCVQEYEFEGRSVTGGYYEIVVYPKGCVGATHARFRIFEPTMDAAFKKLEERGYTIVEPGDSHA